MIREVVRADWSLPGEGVGLRDEIREIEAACRQAMLRVLAAEGRPMSAGELGKRTGFSESRVGKCASAAAYFIRQRRCMAGTRGDERVLIAPHPDLARFYPLWADRLAALMVQVGR